MTRKQTQMLMLYESILETARKNSRNERSVLVGLGVEGRLTKKGQRGRLWGGGAGNGRLDCSGLSLC